MSAAPGLDQSLCHLHPGRPAVARCPRCARFFCRECVTEHDYQLLCKSCIEGLKIADDRFRQIWDWPLRLAGLGTGLLFVYMIFYFAGQILSLIPPAYHEGRFPWFR